MIQADLAELIDDDDGAGERFVLQQAVEQRGLAGAEEASQHSEGNGLSGLAQVGSVAGAHFFLASVLGSSLGSGLASDLVAVFAAVVGADFDASAFGAAGFGAAGFGAACVAADCVLVVVACATGGVRTIFGFGRGVGTPSSDREASSGPPAGVTLAIALFGLPPFGSAFGSPGFLAGPVCTTTGSPRRASCCSRACLFLGSGARSADRNTE